MTLSQLNSYLLERLTPALGAGEAKATARILLEDDLGVTPVKLMMSGDRVLEPETERRMQRYADRITAGEPVQYVLGRARFMGMDFEVNTDTLIPRPETAELVDLVTDRYRNRSDLRVCDIGTGSGCIAISLARALPFSSVTGVDISQGALDVAQRNAQRLAKVAFVRADILQKPLLGGSPFDIIVSNPPYIAQSEASDMERRVTDFEPHTALFVPDSDPLRFYTAIVKYAADGALKPDGTLFFEINPLFATQLQTMCRNNGFDCTLVRDAHGKQRFAICQFL